MALCDPCDEESVFSFKQAMELDEREEYPEQACALLNEWGLSDYYIPAACGGKLDSFEELTSLLRIVARRDLTVVIAHAKTFLGSISIWLKGSDTQKHKLASAIKRHEQVALALTEREHGSDLLAGDTKVIKAGNRYLLSGEKWLINNATRATALTVMARTDPAGGPRGFSLLLVEKSQLNAGCYQHLPKIKTLGIRGTDISGIRFNDCPIPEEALVGRTGAGLEIILEGFQLTRAIVPALALGAADTALRVTMDFALSRRLYNNTVFTIPHSKSVLVDAFLDILICDCVATAIIRAIHAAPAQMSLFSSIAKYFVPTTTENLIRQLSVVLGARHYLREGHWWGVFQKILRDSAILGLFDGSTAVNLNAISAQLFRLADHRAKAGREGLPQQSTLNGLFALDQPAPAFAADRLALHNRGRDDVMAGLEAGLREIEELELKGDVERPTLLQLRRLTRRLLGALRAQDRRLLAANGRGQAFGQSVEMMEMAKRYSTLYAAAACIQIWLRNRDRLGEFFRKGEWLALGLNRLRRSLGGGDAAGAPEMVDRVAQELERRYRERRAFAIVPLDLA
jgi:alkylation response protein AidB-like acyl-CoA dehydrogenase